jgi:hypothetical protein
LINSSTAAVRCWMSITPSSKLQTSLYMMTVSVEALCDRHDGFQISRTVRCFWRTL